MKIKSKQAGVMVRKKGFSAHFRTLEDVVEIPDNIAKEILKNPIFYEAEEV